VVLIRLSFFGVGFGHDGGTVVPSRQGDEGMGGLK